MMLIEHWKHAWKLFSVQVQGAVIVLAAGWGVMPDDWRNAVPKWALVTCAAVFAVATISGRVVKQKPPEDKQ